LGEQFTIIFTVVSDQNGGQWHSFP